jgi:DNA-binding transcriptional regulator YiaG
MNKAKLNKILNENIRAFVVRRDNSSAIVNKDFIKNLRTKLDYTQVVFSLVLGVNVKTVKKWEKGSVEPRDIVKKFLYIIDKHPGVLNDLYSFQSHETTKVNAEHLTIDEITLLRNMDKKYK